MADHFTYDVFLSHNSQDKPRVRKLAEQLREAGLRVWFDDWIIKPGDDIYLAIERGLEAARVQVLCLSPQALGSAWVTLERNTVLFRDPTNTGHRFVPLLLADCDLPDTLRRYKYVDFRQETQAAFEELLTACRGETEAPPPTPQSKPKKKPAKPTPKPVKPPEQAEPLAVLERKLTGHTGWVKSVAVSPDGKWAASGSKDKTVKIWDLETGECRATLKGHTDEVNSVAITPDGNRILSGSNDCMVRVWDVERQKSLTFWVDNGGAYVLQVLSLSDSDIVLAVGNGRTLTLWNSTNLRQIQRVRTGSLSCAAVTPNGLQAVSGLKSGGLEYWELSSSKLVAKLEGHSQHVNSVQITPDGRFAVSGSNDKTVKVWDLKAGTCVGTLEGHQNKVLSVGPLPRRHLDRLHGVHGRNGAALGLEIGSVFAGD
jgi:WD40 repeat protein